MAAKSVSTSKISVWWDIENCQVPWGVEPDAIACNVSSVLHQVDLRGPISISAYGDTNQVPRAVQTALTDTGIQLHHIPSGRKDASDKAILVDMVLWALDNPPPAHILLISGDRDFSNALHKLRMKTYNILLAQPRSVSVSPHLRKAASSVWYWSDLAKGAAIIASETLKLEHTSSSSLGKSISLPTSSTTLPRQEPAQESSPSIPADHESTRIQVPQDAVSQMNASSLPNMSNSRGGFPFVPKFSGPLPVGHVPNVGKEVHCDPNPGLSTYPVRHPRPTSAYFSQQMPPVFHNRHPMAPPAVPFSQSRFPKAPPSPSPQPSPMTPRPTNGNVSNLQAEAPPRSFTIQVLRDWLLRYVLPTNNGYNISAVQRDFETSTGIRLDAERPLGYYGMLDLFVKTCADITRIESPCAGVVFLCARHSNQGAPLPRNGSGTFGRGEATGTTSNGPRSSGGGPISFKPRNMGLFGSGEVPVEHTPLALASNELSAAQVSGCFPSGEQRPEMPRVFPTRKDTLEVLRILLQTKVKPSENGYDVLLIQSDFHAMSGYCLDLKSLGFSDIRHLVENFKDIVQVRSPRTGLCVLYPAGQKLPLTTWKNGVTSGAGKSVYLPVKKPTVLCTKGLLENCRTVLLALLKRESEGCPLERLAEEYRKAFDCELDYRAVGYENLDDLLETLSDVVEVKTAGRGQRFLHLVRAPNVTGPATPGEVEKVKSEGILQTDAAAAGEDREKVLQEDALVDLPSHADSAAACNSWEKMKREEVIVGCSTHIDSGAVSDDLENILQVDVLVRHPSQTEADSATIRYDTEKDTQEEILIRFPSRTDSAVLSDNNALQEESLVRCPQTDPPASSDDREEVPQEESSQTDSAALIDEKLQEDIQRLDINKSLERCQHETLAMLFPPCKKPVTTPASRETSSGVASPVHLLDNYIDKVLLDCRTLLWELLSCHPQEFSQVKLQEKFFRRFGYELDHIKAGFNTLDSLLEFMPEDVKIESGVGGQLILHRLSSFDKEEGLRRNGEVEENETAYVKAATTGPSLKNKQTWQVADKGTMAGSSSDTSSLPLTKLAIPSNAPRAEMYCEKLLLDCKALLQRALRRHVGGYNLAKLPRDFEDSYGYSLDYKLAGYIKLSDLLANFEDFVHMKSLPHRVLFLKPFPAPDRNINVTELPK